MSRRLAGGRIGSKSLLHSGLSSCSQPFSASFLRLLEVSPIHPLRTSPSRLHRSSVLRPIFSFVPVLLAACSSGQNASDPPGWSYDTNPKWPGAIYNFADGSRAMVRGRCHAAPVFVLSNGDYPSDHSTFDFIVDGKRHVLDVFEDRHHGRSGLIVEDSAAIGDLVRAKKNITFRVGSWEKRLPASPAIARLARECAKMRGQSQSA